MYPSIMFTVAITVTAFMLIKVVPIFAEMYSGMGLELPAATATIMGDSDFLRGTGGKVIFFGGIVLTLDLILQQKSPPLNIDGTNKF